jgi:WD40 repeat protein
MVGISKLIVLEVGEGDFDRGFAVVLRIGETGKPHRLEFRGRFPPEPEIPETFSQLSNPVKIFGLSAPRIFKQFQYINRWDIVFLSSTYIGNVREIGERETETVYLWIRISKPDRLIPLIVMREPMPTPVKEAFLEYLLKAFSEGESFYLSVRKAREQLQSFDNNYPCASWLPAICQNPSAPELKYRQQKWRILPKLAALGNIQWSAIAPLALLVISIGSWFIAQTNQQQAARQIREAQETIKLEQQGTTALRQFEFEELEALLEAMDAGQQLKQLVQDGRKLEKYPTVSPILALQTILDNIHERNQLTENQGNFRSASLSPDGTRIVTTGYDTAKIWDISGRRVVELKGNQTSITSASFTAEKASFSPDGTRIVTTSYDTPRVWDTSGRLLVELKGNQKFTKSASFSPDGKRIVTTSDDGTVKVWETSGKILAELKVGQENSFPEPSASLSPDGTRIITTSRSIDGLVKIWDISGQLLTQLKAGKDKFSLAPTASFSPNGQFIFTTFVADTAKLWNISGKLIKEYPVAATGASFSPNGNLIITFSGDETVSIWTTDGLRIAGLRGHRGGVKSASFSSKGQFILVVPYRSDSKAKVWNLGNKQLLFGANDEPFITLNRTGIESPGSFSANGNHLVTISSSGSDSESNNVVNIWDLSDRQFSNIKSLQGNENIQYVLASPDRQYILTSYTDLNTIPGDSASVWDLSGKLLAKLKGEPYIFHPTFSPDGKHIFTSSARGDEPIGVWNLSGDLVAKFKGKRAVFSPDGSRILIISHDQKTAELWDLSGRLLKKIEAEHVAKIKNAIFSPDGQRIILWDSNTNVLAYDFSGKLITSINYDLKLRQLLLNKKVDWQKLDSIPAPSFSPDGQRILTVTYDNTIRLWNLAGKLLIEKSHQDRIKELRFSPDGQYILILFYTGAAQIWDSSGRQFADLKGHQGKIFQASFSPDGQRIITASNDNIVRLWDLSGRILSEFKIPQKNLFFPNQGLKSAFFSQDGKQIIVVSSDGIIRTWRVDGLNELLARGCDWLKDYLATHPKARERLKVCQ